VLGGREAASWRLFFVRGLVWYGLCSRAVRLRFEVNVAWLAVHLRPEACESLGFAERRPQFLCSARFGDFRRTRQTQALQSAEKRTTTQSGFAKTLLPRQRLPTDRDYASHVHPRRERQAPIHLEEDRGGRGHEVGTPCTLLAR